MKVGMRTPSLKKSVKAQTTGKVKRAVKKSVSPGYGQKGVGWIKDPKKAAYNKVYNKTTLGVVMYIVGSVEMDRVHLPTVLSVDLPQKSLRYGFHLSLRKC